MTLTRCLVALVIALAATGCMRRRRTVSGDAGPDEMLTPGGYVAPDQVKKQVEDTLQKEHDKTLQPIVE